MKHWLPILALIAGLGTFISSTQSVEAQATPPPPTAAEVDPFSTYLALEKAHHHESALTRFAGACGIDLTAAKPKYAQKPGKTWKQVPDLSKANDDQEIDFYGTVAVFYAADRILVEQWGMELDTGDYYRLLYCLNKKQITLAESVSWRMAGFDDSADDTTWGYQHRWKLAKTGNLETDPTRFIGLDEKPIRVPKLDADTFKSLKEESVGVKTWADLGLPDVLLR